MQDTRQCGFCEIARGVNRPEYLVAEERTWLAFFPREPATTGHTLLIPRAHVADLWVAEPDVAADLAHAAVLVGRAILRALHPDGMNMITSAGEAAEQSVFHLHLHLVPRWRADGFGRIWPPKGHQAIKGAAPLAETIRAAYATIVAGEREEPSESSLESDGSAM